MIDEPEMVAHGARCAWWDLKSKVATLPGGLPCCPHCKGVLLESPLEEWNADVEQYARESGDTDYPKFVAWQQGKCFVDHKTARRAYDAAHTPSEEGPLQ